MEAAIFYVIIMILNIILTMFPRVPLLNLIFGLLGVAISALTVGDSTMPAFPWFTALMFFTSITVILSAILSLRRG